MGCVCVCVWKFQRIQREGERGGVGKEGRQRSRLSLTCPGFPRRGSGRLAGGLSPGRHYGHVASRNRPSAGAGRMYPLGPLFRLPWRGSRHRASTSHTSGSCHRSGGPGCWHLFWVLSPLPWSAGLISLREHVILRSFHGRFLVGGGPAVTFCSGSGLGG